jgi:hypothetical protein
MNALANSLNASKNNTALQLALTLTSLVEQHASHHYDMWRSLLQNETNSTVLQQRRIALEQCIKSTHSNFVRLAVNMASEARLGPDLLSHVSTLLRSRIVATNIHVSWDQWSADAAMSTSSSFDVLSSTTSSGVITSTWISRDLAVSSSSLHLFLLLVDHTKDLELVHALCIDVLRSHNIASVLILVPALLEHVTYFQTRQVKNCGNKNDDSDGDRDSDSDSDSDVPNDRSKDTKTKVIWPLRDVTRIVLTNYLLEMNSILGYERDSTQEGTMGRITLDLLDVVIQQAMRHLHEKCGWSSSLLLNWMDFNARTGEQGEQEDKEDIFVVGMLIRLIFWDQFIQCKGQQNEWYGRSRSSVQKDAWCALELLSSLLPELIFEHIIDHCVWDKYVINSTVGNGDSVGLVGRGTSGEQKRHVQRAAIALCGDLGRTALECCTRVTSESKGGTYPFVYPDEDERGQIVQRASLMGEALCNLSQAGTLDDSCSSVVQGVLRLLKR